MNNVVYSITFYRKCCKNCLTYYNFVECWINNNYVSNLLFLLSGVWHIVYVIIQEN